MHLHKIAMLFLCSIFIHSSIFAGDKMANSGKTITFKGNVIAFSKATIPDTTTVINTETGQETIKLSIYEPAPVTLNDKPIYRESKITEMKRDGEPANYEGLAATDIFEYLLNNLKKDLASFANGQYRMYISDIVISDAGKLAYYDYEGVFKEPITNADNKKPIYKAMTETIAKHADKLMDAIPSGKPAIINNQAVPCNIDPVIYSFTIKNGKLISMYYSCRNTKNYSSKNKNALQYAGRFRY